MDIGQDKLLHIDATCDGEEHSITVDAVAVDADAIDWYYDRMTVRICGGHPFSLRYGRAELAQVARLSEWQAAKTPQYKEVPVSLVAEAVLARGRVL